MRGGGAGTRRCHFAGQETTGVRTGTLLLTALLLSACESAATPPAIQGGWHLSALRLDPARTAARGGGEVIAIVDTGFDGAAAPGLAARTAGRWDAITGGAEAPDDNGHGTEMS